MTTLSSNGYGKHKVRLSKITRHDDRHDFKEISVNVVLKGNFDIAYTDGDNAPVLPTDTIKNTVYALAKDHNLESIEQFALDLAAHYIDRVPHASSADIEIEEKLWTRMLFESGAHHHAFTGGASEQRTAHVIQTRDSITLKGGLKGLPILKTTGSAFVGFMKDEYTVLPEERDRIMATNLTASWTYNGTAGDFTNNAATIRNVLLETFANHESESVQHTMWEMGNAALAICADISEISMLMPNVHHFMFNLERFGLENNNDIFAPADEPHGYIEGTISR
ncbi:MAG: factor-independent urate hydroxylase [Chloroflexota bacterium]